MALTTLQKTLKAAEFQAILNRNPRLLALHNEISAQNAKIDAMIDRISAHLEKGDEKAAFSELPGGKELFAIEAKPVAPKTEARKTIASKIKPFNS